MYGHRLKQLRENRKLTQEGLAEVIGVSTQQVYRWEVGKNDPTGDMIVKMAMLFEVSSDYLLGLSDDPLPYSSRGDLTEAQRKLLISWENGEFMKMIMQLSEQALAHETQGVGIASEKPAIEG